VTARLAANSGTILVCLTIVLAIGLVAAAVASGVLGFDFRGTLWDPGKAILAGHSPYPAPRPDAIRTGNPSVYPPPAMLVAAPLTVLPWGVGLGIWLTLSVLLSLAAFKLVGVDDVRVLVVALGSAPFVIAFNEGNLTMVLLLGLAAAWRWRDRALIVGLSVCAVVVAKLFLWPLLVWLLVTRRFRAAAYAVISGVATVISSWAVIGFAGFRQYPRLLKVLGDVYTQHTHSLASLGIGLGLSHFAAESVALAVGLAVLGVGIRLVRQEQGDRRMYSAAVLAAVLASPIAWPYYYALLVLPLMLCRPSLTRAWWIIGAFGPLTIVPALLRASPPCCKPDGMAEAAWTTLTTTPPLLVMAGFLLLVGMTALVVLRPAQTGITSRGQVATPLPS
jgi:Glycosyltransferase family 87